MKETLLKFLEKVLEFLMLRKGIGIRFLYTVFFLAVYAVVNTIVQVAVICQFIMLFITRKPHEQIRVFSNKIATYAYKVIRYLIVTENKRPYPFTDLPLEMHDMEWPDFLVEDIKKPESQPTEPPAEPTPATDQPSVDTEAPKEEKSA